VSKVAVSFVFHTKAPKLPFQVAREAQLGEPGLHTAQQRPAAIPKAQLCEPWLGL
jgi:hypothetical protein